MSGVDFAGDTISIVRRDSKVEACDVINFIDKLLQQFFLN